MAGHHWNSGVRLRLRTAQSLAIPVVAASCAQSHPLVSTMNTFVEPRGPFPRALCRPNTPAPKTLSCFLLALCLRSRELIDRLQKVFDRGRLVCRTSATANPFWPILWLTSTGSRSPGRTSTNLITSHVDRGQRETLLRLHDEEGALSSGERVAGSLVALARLSSPRPSAQSRRVCGRRALPR